MTCAVCQGRKWIAPEPWQIDSWRRRYQWATFDYGVNDCPGCVQIPPADRTAHIHDERQGNLP